MVLPRIMIGTEISMPKMSRPQWLFVTPTIPRTLSRLMSTSARIIVLIAAPKESFASMWCVSSLPWAPMSLMPMPTSSTPPTVFRNGMNNSHDTMNASRNRRRIAPAVPYKIAFFCKRGGRFFAAMPMTMELSPPRARSIKIICTIMPMSNNKVSVNVGPPFEYTQSNKHLLVFVSLPYLYCTGSQI